MLPVSTNAIITSFLTLGLSGLVAWTYADYYDDVKSKKHVIQAITDLKSGDLNKRESSSLVLTKFLEPKAGENKSFVYDYNGVRVLLAILKQKDAQNEAVLSNALMALRLICKDVDARRELIRQGGLQQIAEVLLNSQSTQVRQEAARALKTATHFDLKARELPEDIPRGSEGSLHLTRAARFSDLITLLSSTEPKIIQGLSGAIANCSQTTSGALVLNNNNAVRYLVTLMRSPVKGVKNNALIAIANIFKSDIRSNLEIATDPAVMKVALQNIVVDKERVRIAILNYFETVLSLGIPEKKATLARLFLENPESYKYVTLLALEGAYQETVRSATQIHHLLQGLPIELKSQLARLHHKFTTEYQHRRRQQEQLQQQQYMQLMMGMGGMDGMGGGGGMDLSAMLGALGGGGLSMDDLANQMMADE